LLLVRRGTPAAIDVEHDPVAGGISCGLAQGTEESWIEVGYTRNLVIEDRRVVRNGTVSFAKRTTIAGRARRAKRTTIAGRARRAKRTTVLTARDVAG
jgi:hypothetical protein